MLNDREQQVLAALERDLAAEDPALRIRLERRRPHVRWPVVAAGVGLVVAVGLMALGLVGNALLLLMVTSAPLALRAWRRGGTPRWPSVGTTRTDRDPHA